MTPEYKEIRLVTLKVCIATAMDMISYHDRKQGEDFILHSGNTTEFEVRAAYRTQEILEWKIRLEIWESELAVLNAQN